MIQPIWPGFLANTTLYATLLCLIIYGLSAVRARRDLCPIAKVARTYMEMGA